MKRKTFDKMVSVVGIGMSVFLFAAAGLLGWGYSFANNTVKTQLSEQKITIPASTMNKAEAPAVTAFFKANGNKIMTTGKQAEMYADHYLGFHLSEMPTYATASGANRAAQTALAANPNDPALQASAAKAAGTVDTVFKGTMLRGTLLTSYAFWQLGQLAKVGSGVALFAGVLLLILSIAGLAHLRRTPEDVLI